MAEPIIDLSVGDELDYNPAGGFWVMARVEQRPAPGGAAAAAAQAAPRRAQRRHRPPGIGVRVITFHGV